MQYVINSTVLDFTVYKEYCEQQNYDENYARNRQQFVINCVRKAIKEELSDCQRKYLIDYCINGYTTTQISNKYRVNISTVSREITRARKKLHHVLQYCDPYFNKCDLVRRNSRMINQTGGV